MKRSTHYSATFRRRTALTLVEAIAGLALLAIVLVSTMVARAHCQRQARMAACRHEAVLAADALLTRWWRSPGGIPRLASGEASAARRTLLWRTTPALNPPVAALGAQVVRLEIFEVPAAGSDPLVTVEVVVSKVPSRKTADGDGPPAAARGKDDATRVYPG